MNTEIIISGFGGQGALFAGQLVSYAAMDEGRQVTWIPSYGPEMRGGTANCTVVISDEEIGSPLVSHPDVAIVMNRPSLDKYEPLVKPGGLLVVNSSMVDRPTQRIDIRIVEIPANEIAESLGNKRLLNVVLLGSLLVNLPILSSDSIGKALIEHLPARHANLITANMEAFRKGAQYIAQPVS
jgi:2-oxoglutarate ferredoxin oxidoreductase subunit gamma